MKSLTRYVFFQCLGATLIVAIALTAAAWLIQALKLVELVVDRGIGLGLFAELVAFTLPQLLALILPIAGFVGVQFAYSRLNTDSELIVMRACGVSQSGLARPALLVAGLLTVVMFALTLYLLPASKGAFKYLQFQIRNEVGTEMLQEGSFTPISGSLTVYVRQRDALGELRGLLIQDTRNPERPVTLTAETGMIVRSDGKPRVLMFNGSRQTWDTTTHQLSVLSFKQWSLDLGQYRDVAGIRDPQADERFLPQLFFPDAKTSPEDRMRFFVEGNSRLVAPLYCLTYILITLAAQLTGQLNRRGQTRRILAAWLAVALLESASVGLTNLANHQPDVVVLMYLVAILPGAVALYALIRPGTVRTPGGLLAAGQGAP